VTEIIPAIDIINGKCVRLTQGDYNKSREYGDPLEMALKFEEHGIRRLHFVDLDGARLKKVVNHAILEKIALRTSLVIDAGGGLRSEEDLRIVFESGARMATGGSVAVKDPQLFLGWLEKFGAERIILGADFKKGRIAVSGWQEDTELNLFDFISGFYRKGLRKSICTDIEQDGMLTGPARVTYQQLMQQVKGIQIIASGGISSMKDIETLSADGLAGIIVGKAIYEGRISLKEIEHFIRQNS